MSLTKPGGSTLWTAFQLVDLTEILSIGTMAEQSIWDGAISSLVNGRDGFFGLGCKPSKGAGDLDWLVDPGVGVITLSGGDTDVDLTPLYVPTQLSGTLAAHDPTNPRIDIISLAPLSVDDLPTGQKIFDGSGGFNPLVINTRRRRFHSVTVTTGTPAVSPVAPATPAGHLLVGEFAVPATAGPIINVADKRQLTGLASTANQHRPWRAVVTNLSAKAANIRTATIEIQDLEGNQLPAPEGWPADANQRFYLRCRVFDNDYVTATASYQIQAPGGGAVNVTAVNKGEMLVKTGGGDGTFTLTILDATASYTGVLYLSLDPVVYFEATGATTHTERSKGGVPVTIEMDWS